jgi:dienelactone hydrolase
MAPLFCDRALLRSRIGAAFEVVHSLDFVEQNAIAAIGFCFGGLAVIELVRSGKKLAAAVTFHALLGNTVGPLTATALPSRPNSSTKLLVLHGYKDPLVSSQDLVQFEREMADHGIDWQLYTYGIATHAFSNPLADQEQSGMKYNAVTAKRSWQAMTNFFAEVFNS